MKTRTSVACLLLVPGLLSAQDTVPPPETSTSRVPPDLAEVELARSRACVPALARVAELDQDLRPLVGQAARLQALDRAVRLEDSTEVAPFEANDPLEAAVRQWFVEDGEMGRRWAESQDTAVARQRDEARAAIRARIGEALGELEARGQGRLSEAGDIQEALVPCEGAILVRSAVAAVCDTLSGPVCEALEDTTSGTLRFVDEPADLWDVEEYRPWTNPEALHVPPQGGLAGGRTTVRARRGNVRVVVAVAPMIRDRSTLEPEQADEFDAFLDTLGFTFEHPRLVFAPAIELQINAVEPLGGETHYMLHFGDLSDPPNQVVWSGPVGPGGPVQSVFPAAPGALARLERGEALSLTAVAVSEGPGEAVEGEAVYSIALPAVNQGRAVGALLAYMAGGDFGQDLARVVPPDTTGGGG